MTPLNGVLVGFEMAPPAKAPDFEESAGRYRLLGFERWAAKRHFDRRYLAESSAAPASTESPDTVVIAGVIYAWGRPGLVLALCGIALLVVSGGAAYAYWICYLGIAVGAVGVVRWLTLASAMKRCQAQEDKQGGLPPPPG